MGRETSIPTPKAELYHYDVGTNTYKPLAENGAIPVVVVGGGTGGSSMTFLSGAVAPTADKGADGDVYLNTANGNLHKKESGAWTLLMNIKGATGSTGAKGDTGVKGADGFGTKEQYDALNARLTALEEKVK